MSVKATYHIVLLYYIILYYCIILYLIPLLYAMMPFEYSRSKLADKHLDCARDNKVRDENVGTQLQSAYRKLHI